MPRTARIVVPGIAHHVGQRGNRRRQTFFTETDTARTVDLVAGGCRAAGVDALASCPMPDHVDLVLVPPRPAGLSNALVTARRKPRRRGARQRRCDNNGGVPIFGA